MYCIKYAERRSSSGFTLIELLLYTSLMSIMMLAIASFLPMLLEARIKNQTIAEVEGQGFSAMQSIIQSIRNADVVNAPIAGAGTPDLSLTVSAPLDPTVFDLSDGAIVMREGAGDDIPLTNNRVVVTGLSFTNFSLPDTSDIIRIQYTISHANPSGRNIYDFSKEFIGSATLRSK